MDKPEGISSHDAIDRVRVRLDLRRIGHTGTLDPFASGLLVVLVGRATRLARFADGERKRYTGDIRLGATTTTDDGTGAVIEEHEVEELQETDITRAMATFVGDITQRPPAFSAKKINGKRAYRSARQGQPVALRPVTVTVHAFEPTKIAGPNVSFVATVGAGTYIRALARDVGAALGVGGHLRTLRRTHVASFDVRDAVAPEAVDASAIRPAGALISHLHAVALDAASADLVRHGRAIPSDGAVSGPVALFEDEQLIAVAESTGNLLKPRVVVAP